MDPINSQTSYFPYHTKVGAPSISSSQPASNGGNKTQTNDFGALFDDDSLLKLQGNLEAIAQMAESALKSIKS